MVLSGSARQDDPIDAGLGGDVDESEVRGPSRWRHGTGTGRRQVPARDDRKT
jgi:hypothetical protein